MQTPLKSFKTLSGSLFASVLISVLLSGLLAAQVPDHSFIGGLRINDGQPFGIIGTAHKIGPDLSITFEANPSPTAKAYSGRIAYHLQLAPKWQLLALAGPAAEGIPHDEISDDPTYYLMTSSGFAIRRQFESTAAVWLSIDYIAAGGRISPWKFALGISFPFTVKPKGDT